MSKKLTFPKETMETREDCYQFEHKSKTAFYEQVIGMGKKPIMITDLRSSPLWDYGVRKHLNLMTKHEQVFNNVKTTPQNMLINSLLDHMAIQHKSDKSSRFHNYAVKYDKILTPRRASITSILEIGVAQGQSIKMWTDYFPNATIHGADISSLSKICEAYSNRIKFHLLDQRDEAQLKNVKSGGIYIVEDTTTSYWKEYKNYHISPTEYFKTLVDEVNLKGAKGNMPLDPPQEFKDWDKGWHRREDCFNNVPLFESIQFMNGFIVIYKK
jgi:hypothetical protein